MQASLSRMFTKLSLAYNYLMGWDIYSSITDGLYLGMMPTADSLFEKARHLHEKIQDFIKENSGNKRELKLVVSVIEKEMVAGEAEHWQQLGVEHVLLPMADYTADVSTFDAIKTIFKMKKCMEAGGAVYVHCKAGRSRSAMICAIFLAMFVRKDDGKNYTLDEAIQHLTSMRVQVDIGNNKKKKAEELLEDITIFSQLMALVSFQGGLSLIEVLRLKSHKFATAHKDALIGFLDEDQLRGMIHDEADLTAICEELSVEWRIYLIDKLGQAFLNGILKTPQMATLHLKLRCWKAEQIENITDQFSAIINSDFWNTQGESMMSVLSSYWYLSTAKKIGTKVPTSIANMQSALLHERELSPPEMLAHLYELVPQHVSYTRTDETRRLYRLIKDIYESIELNGVAAQYIIELDVLKTLTGGYKQNNNHRLVMGK